LGDSARTGSRECGITLKPDREADLRDMLVDIEIIIGVEVHDGGIAVLTAAELRIIQVHVQQNAQCRIADLKAGL
jgi:hypothetical protein